MSSKQNKGKPELPTILNSSYSAKTKTLFLKWNVVDDTNLPLTELVIELFEYKLNKTTTIGIFNLKIIKDRHHI